MRPGVWIAVVSTIVIAAISVSAGVIWFAQSIPKSGTLEITVKNLDYWHGTTYDLYLNGVLKVDDAQPRYGESVVWTITCSWYNTDNRAFDVEIRWFYSWRDDAGQQYSDERTVSVPNGGTEFLEFTI